MRRPFHALLTLVPGLLSWTAHAQTPGLLRFVDGTVLPGVLIESTDGGGLFRSARFGEIRFTKAEAAFAPTPSEAAGPSSTPSPVSASTAPAAPVPPPKNPMWPESWSIGVSGYWQSSDGTKESDAAIDLDATWATPNDELKLHVDSDYRIVSDSVDNNEQSGRVRWVHSFSSPWVGLGTLQAHRNTFTIDPLPTFDYLLLQGTLGAGVRHTWSPKSKTLLVLGHDWVSLRLLDHGVRVSTHATSLLLDNKIRLSPKLLFEQTLYLYLWEDSSSGVDSRAEISYALTDNLSVGLRHEIRRNAVNLDIGTFSKFSVTTRVGF